MLETRIGRGGMGEVWRARHREQHVPVAVKVLTAAGSAKPMFVESFANEVRAVAGLDHPHVAMVYDTGTVTPVAAVASRGVLVPGTPYLAMELVGDGKTLVQHIEEALSWDEIRTALSQLLDALAHAHARNVIHKDLKLSNVLFDKDKTLKLTDFGIAHALAAESDRFRWGTPGYMAPEQLMGRWWEYGPWTDLYALGCCAYALVAGRRPFDETSPASDAPYRKLPLLEPRMPVPDELEDWLYTLCRPNPIERFQSAADALARFEQFCDPFVDPHVRERDSRRVAAAGSERAWSHAGGERVELPTATTMLVDTGFHDVMPAPGESPRVNVTFPQTWQRGRPPRASQHLLGAGLGLYEVRRIPTVGRVDQRDELWRQLGEVKGSGTARVALITGPAGSGKTRLAEWLMERAHEAGVAHWMRAEHPSEDASGLASMVAQFVRSGGRTRDQAREQLAAALRAPQGEVDPKHVEHLLDLVSPLHGDKNAVRKGARHAALVRLVSVQARRRPLILFLDDAPRGVDALQLALTLIDTVPSVGPVLLLLAARDEDLVARPVERGLIEDLTRRRTATTVLVPPMPPAEQRELVEHLIGLDSGVAKVVEQRAAGNPMFAVQLIGDWVHRGILRPGPRGFEVAPGTEVNLPDDLHAIWALRMNELLEGRPASDQAALEVAAILGPRVEEREWAAVCGLLGVARSPDLRGALLGRRLARLDPAGSPGAWTFAHAMLRESLERSAEEGERARKVHAACAQWLVAEGKPDPEQLARHLLGSEDLEGALDPLAAAIEARCIAGEFDRADALLSQWQDAAANVGLAEGDARTMRGLLAAAQVHRFRDRPEEMLATCERLEAGVLQSGWPREYLALVQAWRARTARLAGDFHRAVSLYREALELAHAADTRDAELLSSLHARLGHTLADLGVFVGAEAEFRAAEELAARAEDMIGVGEGQVGRARVAVDQGEVELATRLAAAARESFRAASHRWGQAQVAELFGRIARERRTPQEAQRWFRTAGELWRALGTDSEAVGADLLAVMVLIDEGQDGGPTLERCAARAEQWRDRPLLVRCHYARMAVAAVKGDARAFHRWFREIEERQDDLQLVSADLAWMAERAGRAAEACGWKDGARQALELALLHWNALQRVEDCERVQVMLDRP